MILFSVIVFVLPFLVSAASSQNDSVGDILAKIMGAQKINKISEIDCQKIADGESEQLGEAIMDIMHPDESEHELMDRMMGGEGSDSLKAMHIIMGKRYLGCTSGTMGMGGGIMGGGMMGGGEGMMGNWSSSLNQNLFNESMMGNFGVFAWFGWFFMVLSLLLILLGIAAAIKWLIKK